MGEAVSDIKISMLEKDGEEFLLPTEIDLAEAIALVGLSVPHLHFESVAAVSTTSGTDVLIAAGASFTPPAGTYLVWHSVSTILDTNNSSFFSSIYLGGVKVTSSEREARRGGGQFSDVPRYTTALSKITVNGSQVVQIRWRRTAGTATTRSIHLGLLRVGNV
jgi:hypothetical protein